MKNRILYFLAACALGMPACKKELNIPNPNQPTTAVFWKTASDATLGVNSIYSTFHRGNISRWQLFAYIIRADEGYSTSPNPDVINYFDVFNYTNYNNGYITGLWGDNYIGIARANQVLDNVTNIQMNDTAKQIILGQAKFLRALFYYNIAMLYGNGPLIIHTSTPSDKPPTVPQAAIWSQVVKDLTEAAPVLPVLYTSANDVGRATRGAAYALLAKAYMQQRKFTEALVPLAWLANGPGKSLYTLIANYSDNFNYATKNNPESIFEIQYATNTLDNHDDDTDPRTDNLNFGTSINPFFAPRPVGFTDGQARRWPVYEFLKETTTSGGRDPRLAQTFLYDSTDVRGPKYSLLYGKSFYSRFDSAAKTPVQDVFFRKFLNDKNGETSESFHSNNDYRLIRYADVLLMYAETLNETGSTSQAYAYVDQVRSRAGLAPLQTIMPGMMHDQFLAQIKHERITELTGEGHRWDDLYRWGDLGPALQTRDAGFKNFVKGKHEFYPIPQLDLDINPNLKQNPGY